jgi:hypothetical protein
VYKKALKVTTILAALLLMSVAAIQMLSAQQLITQSVDKDYVSNGTLGSGTTMIFVTIDDPNRAGDGTLPIDDIRVVNMDGATTTEILVGDLAVEEVGAAGVFKLTVNVHPTSTSPIASQIAAGHAERIQITYTPDPTDGTARNILAPQSDDPFVVVDAEAPTISNMSPADDDATNDSSPTLRADISDAHSGLGLTPGVAASKADVQNNSRVIVEGGPSLPVATDLGGGTWQIVYTPLLTEGAGVWSVQVDDAVGNRVNSDPFTINIDSTAPEFVAVSVDPHSVTGNTLDAGASSDTDSRKAIELVFNDDMDGSSISGVDFRVELVAGGTALAVDSATHDDALPRSVFVTMVDDLPSDATPLVTIIGIVADAAGNQNSAGENISASDGLPPAVTIATTVDGAAGTLTSGEITVRVSVDETVADPAQAFAGNIGLAVRKVSADGSVATSAALVGGTRTIIASGTQWDWAFTFDASDIDTDEGAYNAYARIFDPDDNAGDNGVASGAASDDMILFEVDRGIPAPTVTFSNDDPNTFVNLGFTGEASEYDGDTHGRVTGVTATVDGSTVEVSTIDSITYTIAAPAGGYSVAEHDLDVTATDEAGNTVAFDLAVEIIERVEFSIDLRPGLNLVSLPGSPSSTAINDVIPATHPINQVFTYDPTLAGGWLVAERGDDELFAGTLTSIGPGLAYFVRTTTFEPLPVFIPRLTPGRQTLPPAISLQAGWNLVPVADPSGDEVGATTLAAATYFTTIDPVRVYGLNVFGQLTPVDVANDDVVLGDGYWVYVTGAGVLIP